ncbi:hypothetical protein QBC35DRAFT_463454 [Podospora australis]|uniref:Nucleoporin n=1 Tax=Podospora australis TaxID=1536484 RepID=A0AAN7AIH4_9PEZI|nr:hypothetical protein QBC35DRAFT_463454 [Podospora australis]
MSGVGSFPQTPVASRRGPAGPPGKSQNPPPTNPNPLPIAPQQGGAPPSTNAPIIPLNILDAPTQRLYAFGVYGCLFAWKLYDWSGVVDENTESFWLFLKWIAIDFVFLFGIPELRIPWLELSQPFVIVTFVLHALLDWMFMFNVGLPWQGFLLGFVKMFYDREIAISESNVKISSILHNQSLIMGRQVINILPEGSAILNPERQAFCLDRDRKIAAIPLFFNATIPVEVEIIRTDLETNQQEVMKLSRVQLRDIERKAKRDEHEDAQTVQFDLPVKKAGAYHLGRVLDEYKLEVQRSSPQTFVVPCPKAWVGPVTTSGKCRGELSDLSLQVEGTPPLRISYSRTINGKEYRDFHFQSLQPEGFVSPLSALRSSGLVHEDDEDISWAKSQRVPVGLNESMDRSGIWQYSVDEVQDGFGNVVKYVSPADDPDAKPKSKNLVQTFKVKERPSVRLEGCDLRNPMRGPKGDSKELPVKFEISGPAPDKTAHSLSWHFSPIDTLTKSGDHGEVISTGSYVANSLKDRPRISAPGLYTLKSISADGCEGEIQEPSSCLLLNPLEPTIALRSKEIPDTCAGNSIGLQVDIDLIGTPPFVVEYLEIFENGKKNRRTVKVPGLRYQIQLKPAEAGDYRYIFTTLSDDVYRNQKLSGPEYVLEQSVKPQANAKILNPGKKSACLGDKVTADIKLDGDAPFTLEWEVIHDGKRRSEKATNIEGDTYRIETPALNQGGEYTLALTSVQDRRGCRNFLQKELKISVRRQSPRAAFGQVGHKRKIMGVEGGLTQLPLRLTGEGPWKVQYTNINEGTPENPKIREKTIQNDNDYLYVNDRGTYKITDVWDKQCPGVVDSKAAQFEVDWYPRPELSVLLSHGVKKTDTGFSLEDVCEGDVSGFEVAMQGTAPFTVEYEVRHKPLQGSGGHYKKKFDAALRKESIQADTSKPGLYTYKFTSLEDHLYDADAKRFKALEVQQKVNRKPSAAFVKPGQTFKYCKTEQGGEDGIPVTLTGVPPFALEVEIKHQSAALPEIYRTPIINTNTYEIRIPRHQLRLGTQHIRIRDVKDGSGCHSVTANIAGPSVQVQLFEAPTIYPLETRTDYCVGERISYTLSGLPPFEVWYTFEGVESKARSETTNFRRLAHAPGEFAITTISDKASECRAPVNVAKTIHPMPAVKISRGRNSRVDIHEGGEVEIMFEFWGTPPFEFTYTRSSNAKKGQKSQVLETRHDISHEHSKIVRASQEGTYEVVAIKDRYCSFSTMGADDKAGKKPQKQLAY